MGKYGQYSLPDLKSKLGVELIGIVSAEQSTSKALKDQAAFLLPGVKSIVILGKEIYREVLTLLRSSKEVGEADPAEFFGPHGDYLNSRLTKAVYDLTDLFRKEGYRSLPLPAAGCPTDQRFSKALFSYKHAAQLAGLGTIGRHSLLITPEYGPRVRLAGVLTEAPLEPSPAVEKNHCIDCDACIRVCPSKALQMPAPGEVYSMNKFACRTYRQAGLTCSICMKVCDEVLS